MSPTDTPSASLLQPPYRALTLCQIGLISIVAFEEMAISTVMPTIVRQIGATGEYALAFSAMFTAQLLGIVLARAWIEARGPRPVLTYGQLLFAGGSLVAGLAPTLAVFLLGRVLAGLGGGLLVVSLYVVVGAVYPVALRPRVFAWVASAWVLPSIIGPLVAAALSDLWSWRIVFLLVVPAMGLTIGVLSRQGDALDAARPATAGTLPQGASGGDPEPPPGGDRPRASATAAPCEPTAPPPRERPESPSAPMSGREAVLLGLLVAAGAGLFQWAGIALVPPRPGPVLGLLVGIACLAVAAPRILPAGTVRLARGLPSVIAARALFTAAFGATVTFIPLWLVSQRQMSQAEAGILLAVASLGWSAGSWAQGRDALAAVGHRLIPAGAICVAAAATGYSGMAAFDGPTVLALPAGALLGIGMGLGTSSQSVLTLRLAPAAQHPAASSALTLADTMGSVVGISLTGTVFASLASHPAHVTFTAVWVTAAAFGAWAIVAAFRVLPHDDRRPGHQVD